MPFSFEWELSSAGRAPPLQGGCRRFDPCSSHHFSPTVVSSKFPNASHFISKIKVSVRIEEKWKPFYLLATPSGRIIWQEWWEAHCCLSAPLAHKLHKLVLVGRSQLLFGKSFGLAFDSWRYRIRYLQLSGACSLYCLM